MRAWTVQDIGHDSETGSCLPLPPSQTIDVRRWNFRLLLGAELQKVTEMTGRKLVAAWGSCDRRAHIGNVKRTVQIHGNAKVTRIPFDLKMRISCWGIYCTKNLVYLMASIGDFSGTRTSNLDHRTWHVTSAVSVENIWEASCEQANCFRIWITYISNLEKRCRRVIPEFTTPLEVTDEMSQHD